MAAAANGNRSMSGNNNTTLYEFEAFPDFDSFNFDRYSASYPNVVAFVKGYFSTRKHLFHPLKSLYDPFIQGTTGADGKKTYTDFYAWYKGKNPLFGSNKDLYIPEYEIALVQICRDLLFVDSKGKYILSNNARRKTENLRKTKKNDILTHAKIKKIINNNITELKSKYRRFQPAEVQKKTYGITRLNNSSKHDISLLLNFIDDNLRSQTVYVYKIFLEILFRFLTIMSCGAPGSDSAGALDNGLEKFMEYFIKFPLLVYPTYMQIDFKNVLLLAASPVINFRLTNRFRFVHDENFPPIGELEHDVDFHGRESHKCNTGTPITCYNHIFHMNQFISILKPYFDYDEKDASLYVAIETEQQLVISQETQSENTLIMNDNQRMVCYCLLLFELIHERQPKYLYADIQHYLKICNTEEKLKSELTSSHPIKFTNSILKVTDIFDENNENKAYEKFKFLRNIDRKNVAINFIRLLYSLKAQINGIDLTTEYGVPVYL